MGYTWQHHDFSTNDCQNTCIRDSNSQRQWRQALIAQVVRNPTTIRLRRLLCICRQTANKQYFILGFTYIICRLITEKTLPCFIFFLLIISPLNIIFFSLTVTPMRNISEVYLFNQINKIYKLSPLSPKETKGDNLCILLDNCVERK